MGTITRKGNIANYGACEVMHLGRETIDITLLNRRNSQVCSLVCPSLRITPHEPHFTLKQMETTTEGYSQSKGRVVEPIPNRYIYKTFPHLRCRELCKRRGREAVWVTGKGVCYDSVSPRSVRRYILTVSPTCLLKREFNKVAPMDIPRRMETAHVTSTLHNRQPKSTGKGSGFLQEWHSHCLAKNKWST